MIPPKTLYVLKHNGDDPPTLVAVLPHGCSDGSVNTAALAQLRDLPYGWLVLADDLGAALAVVELFEFRMCSGKLPLWATAIPRYGVIAVEDMGQVLSWSRR